MISCRRSNTPAKRLIEKTMKNSSLITMVHDHISVPVNLETGKDMLELKP